MAGVTGSPITATASPGSTMQSVSTRRSTTVPATGEYTITVEYSRTPGARGG